MKVTLEELKFEKFLRDRADGNLTWTSKDGREIDIKDLQYPHLVNIINCLQTVKKDSENIKPESFNFY